MIPDRADTPWFQSVLWMRLVTGTPRGAFSFWTLQGRADQAHAGHALDGR